jgi:hypothetical protein
LAEWKFELQLPISTAKNVRNAGRERASEESNR